MAKCVLCGAKATATVQDNASRTIYNCQSCGLFVVSDLSLDEVKHHACDLAAYFTNRKIVDVNDVVLISFQKAKKDKGYLQLTVDKILKECPKEFAERKKYALRNLIQMSPYEGKEIKVDGADMGPVFYLKSFTADALIYMIKSLQADGLVDVVHHNASSFLPCGVVVTQKVWDQQSGAPVCDEDTALILSYGEQDEVKELFRKVAGQCAQACGYKIPEENRAGEANPKADLALIGNIRACRLVISDLTRCGGQAYYAAGLAETLGKPCILTCHEDAVEELDINTNHIRVLAWSDEESLGDQIEAAIKALA